MQKTTIIVLLFVAMFSADAYSQNNGGAAPQGPEELTNYLKALNEYYAIVARPRCVFFVSPIIQFFKFILFNAYL